MIYIIESIIESSTERDQNQIKTRKEDKRNHITEKPFDENMAKKESLGSKKVDHYLYLSFVVHTLIIEKGWINESFLQGLKHNTWVSIPGFVQNGIAQYVQMYHKKKFHRSLQTMKLLPM